MFRRDFLKLISVTPFLGINITPSILYNPHPAQIAFLEAKTPLTLYGIPYYQLSDIRSNSYLGISREFK